MGEFLRLTVGAQEANERVVEALAEFMQSARVRQDAQAGVHG
jgi:histidinol-phosphate aminotransferase